MITEVAGTFSNIFQAVSQWKETDEARVKQNTIMRFGNSMPVACQNMIYEKC